MPRRRRRTRCVSRSGEILGLEEQILGLEERCIRVVAPDVGGGFGPKARLYPEEIVLAALALIIG
jgi:carbon-monoxide dehydrogenase large subunit